jgi:hypothetical protein
VSPPGIIRMINEQINRRCLKVLSLMFIKPNIFNTSTLMLPLFIPMLILFPFISGNEVLIFFFKIDSTTDNELIFSYCL